VVHDDDPAQEILPAHEGRRHPGHVPHPRRRGRARGGVLTGLLATPELCALDSPVPGAHGIFYGGGIAQMGKQLGGALFFTVWMGKQLGATRSTQPHAHIGRRSGILGGVRDSRGGGSTVISSWRGRLQTVSSGGFSAAISVVG
jgi:hypothetical protein